MSVFIAKKSISEPVSALKHVGIVQHSVTEIPRFRKVYTPLADNESSLVAVYSLLDEKIFDVNSGRKDRKYVEDIFVNDSQTAIFYLTYLLDIENWVFLPKGKMLQLLMKYASHKTVDVLNETIVLATLTSDFENKIVVEIAYALSKVNRLETGTLQALIGSEIDLGKRGNYFNSRFEEFALSI